MFNWDDIKFFLEVSKTLNLTKASASLNVDQTTVYRRILRLEKKTGKKLLKKTGNAFVLTPWGEGLASQSANVKEEIDRVESYLSDETTELFGTVNITTTNVIANVVLPEMAQKFHKIYPSLKLEITVCEDFFDMFKREADIAIRSSDTVEPHVHAVKIGKGGWALYASKKYVEGKPGAGSPDFYKKNQFIIGSERIADIKSSKWLESKVDKDNIILRANSMPCIYSAVKSGLGVGMLPSVYKMQDVDLVELTEPDPKYGSTIWLIAHSDLIQNEKIRICLGFFENELRKVFSF